MSTSQEFLSFVCSRCGVQLRVPVSMAGIEGPCPSCAAIIKAPESPSPDTAGSAPASQAYTAPLSPPTVSSPAYADPPVAPSGGSGPCPAETKPDRAPESTASKEKQAPPSNRERVPSLREPTDESTTLTSSPSPQSRALAQPAVVPPAETNSAKNIPSLGNSDLDVVPGTTQQKPENQSFHTQTNTGTTKLSAASSRREPSEAEETPVDPLVTLKPEAIRARPPKAREPLPTNTSLPSERRTRAEKKKAFPPAAGKSGPNPEPAEGITSQKSDSMDSSSVVDTPEAKRPPRAAEKPGKLETERAVKLNVHASSLGAMVSHEHAGTLENRKRSHPRWTGMSFLLIFLTLSAVLVYLVLDLTGMLPHADRYQQHSGPAPAENSSITSEVNEGSSSAAAGIIQPVPKAPSAGVFKIDPADLFPESFPDNAASQSTSGKSEPAEGANPVIAGATDKNVAPSGAELIPPLEDAEPPITDSAATLFEERDVKVTGEVSLPPLIDLNPSRNALPDQSNLPSAPAETLTLFLAARDLSERRPYMTDSRRSEAELERGPLAGELPPVTRQRFLKYIKDHSESTDERFFEVSFERESTAPILIQVTADSSGRLRIHTDAFLDLYNDEMARFQAVPVKGQRTFHTLADAYKQCFEEKIPGAEEKSYIKLRQHEQVTARLQAYFQKDSEISQQIGQSEALPWGRSGICTVTVRWNTDQGRPFVELVRIDDLSWSP